MDNKLDEKGSSSAAEPPGTVRELPVEVVVGRTKVVVILKANTSVTARAMTTTVAENY
jgi:hypothetical protein